MISQHKEFFIFLIIAFIIIMTFKKSFYGYIIFILIIFLRPQDDRPFLASFRIPQITAISVFLSFVFNEVVAKQKKFWIQDKTWKYFLLFFFWMIISSFFATYKDIAWAAVNEFVFIVLLFYLTVQIVDSEKKLKILFYTILGCGLHFAYMLQFRGSHMGESIGGQQFFRLNFIRYNYNFGQPNYLAFTMIFMFCLALVLSIYSSHNALKLLLFASGIIYIYTLMQTASRGATLALLVVMVIFWLYSRKKIMYLVITALIISLALPLVKIYMPNYFSRLETVKNYEEDASTTDRLELWKIGLNFIQGKPLFGIGWGNFDQLAFNSAHNSYIQIASELGITGFLFWVVFLFKSWKDIFVTKNSLNKGTFLFFAALGLELSIIGYVIQSLTSGIGHRELFYLIAAISVSIRMIPQNSNYKAKTIT